MEANAECGAIKMVHEFWFYMHWVGYLPFVHRTRLWYNNAIRPKFKWLQLLETKMSLHGPTQQEEFFEESIFLVSHPSVISISDC